MNVENLVRKNILNLKPYTSARESHLDGILLDANENSIGSVVAHDWLELNRYPDPNQRALRKAVSDLISVPQENLFFGVGSDEIIELFVKIFCNPREDEVIICEPTYGMYKVCCDTNDVAAKNVPLDSNFDIDLDAVKNAVTEKTKLIFLCSPNNPSANMLSKEKIFELAKSKEVMIVVDEAYIDFAKHSGLAKEAVQTPNFAVIRTFSKAWGMAAVRCGYSVASEFVTKLLFKVKAPYNINKLTSDIILRAISNKEKYLKLVDEILNERNRIAAALEEIKRVKKVLPSDANFISFAVDKPQTVFSYLESKGIIIRDRSNQFNFNGYLRVSVGTIEENNKFIEELKNILL
ncbi:MAG: histidinol phosphate aminotransferase [Ignavibacteria bacterium]|nr:MAG: histidinol phosphate aminotransferase [Ignavibacteria bacterium]KAF0159903.1 MAG: histidinol phosphate aminotransferase [Ignavibacteria bacterium]